MMMMMMMLFAGIGNLPQINSKNAKQQHPSDPNPQILWKLLDQQVHAKCSGRKKKKPGKNGYRNEHKKERGTRRTLTTTTARALGHQGGRRKKQFGGGRRTGGGREVCGELATALRGEVGYKQGFWQAAGGFDHHLM